MSSPAGSQSRQALVAGAVALVLDAFDDYNARFADLTRRARRRFEQRDHAGMRRDAVERSGLYDQCIAETIGRLERLLAERLFARGLWADVRDEYAVLLAGRLDAELYKTFFNTLSRRLFRTRGVDPKIEFIALDIEPTDHITHPVDRSIYTLSERPGLALTRLFEGLNLAVGWQDAGRDAGLTARRLVTEFRSLDDSAPVLLEMLKVVFYRDRRAYLVGRVLGPERWLPCVIALVNEPEGLRVDAVLTRRLQVSILFGFTHSYFHADLPTVGDAVAFLRSVLPDKPVDELYTVLGRAKQGKTERYRHFFGYLGARAPERLAEAEGTRGMVMRVFTLPSYPLVFKLMRDRFDPVKAVSREQVLSRYRLVFNHERAGRLVDAQEYRDLAFPEARFEPDLLETLERDCGRTLVRRRGQVILRHCFVQRRVRPLNLFVREAGRAAVESAVLDYGQAVRDLARSNLFPGDLFTKNFGVTRSGRVVFYDYDEVSLITDCRFRNLPKARSDEEALFPERWTSAEPGDVFPEEFARFVDLPPDLKKLLSSRHGELFDPAWWREVQVRLTDPETLDVPPYAEQARL